VWSKKGCRLLGGTFSAGLNIHIFGFNSFALALSSSVLVHQFVYLYTVPTARFPDFTTLNGRNDVNQITRDIE
jgi:hypothetical protein